MTVCTVFQYPCLTQRSVKIQKWWYNLSVTWNYWTAWEKCTFIPDGENCRLVTLLLFFQWFTNNQERHQPFLQICIKYYYHVCGEGFFPLSSIVELKSGLKRRMTPVGCQSPYMHVSQTTRQHHPPPLLQTAPNQNNQGGETCRAITQPLLLN